MKRGLGGVEDRQPAEHGAVGDAVERRIEKAPNVAAPVRSPRHRAVEHVEQRGEPEEPAGGLDVPGRVDDPAASVQSVPTHVIVLGWTRASTSQFATGSMSRRYPVLDPVGQNLHATPRRTEVPRPEVARRGRQAEIRNGPEGVLQPGKLSRVTGTSNQCDGTRDETKCRGAQGTLHRKRRAERRAAALIRTRSVHGDRLERHRASSGDAADGHLLDRVRRDLTQEQLVAAAHVT